MWAISFPFQSADPHLNRKALPVYGEQDCNRVPDLYINLSSWQLNICILPPNCFCYHGEREREIMLSKDLKVEAFIRARLQSGTVVWAPACDPCVEGCWRTTNIWPAGTHSRNIFGSFAALLRMEAALWLLPSLCPCTSIWNHGSCRAPKRWLLKLQLLWCAFLCLYIVEWH